MVKRILLIVSAVVLLLAVVFTFWYLNLKKQMAMMMAMQPPPPTVSSTVAKQETWRTHITAIGTLESRAGVTVRCEVGGRVTKVTFTSGSRVKAGDILAELDDSIEQAQLKGLVAQAKLARISLERAQELVRQNSIAIAELDAADAAYNQAAAAVEQLATTISKKKVTAPFAGRVGITMVNPGQFMSAGDAIVQLEESNPIHADFGVPQQDISRIRPGMNVTLTVDAFPGRAFAGKIEAVNARVSDATRNIRVRATLPNDDETLRPGMFAHISVEQPAEQNVIVLPTAAIVANPYGDAVYVLTEETNKDSGKKELVARQQFVKTGAARGNLISVLTGLKGGEQVVTSGQLKLRNGIAVEVNNTITPSENPDPKPAES